MTQPLLEHEFQGHTFYFNDTFMAKDLIKEIFSDNYKVLEGKVEFSPGDVILDVGACEGMFSIMMAKLFPHARIIAIEPVPRTYYHMVRNIGLNGCTNIEPLNVGLGKEIGTKTMFVGLKGDSGGSSSEMTFNPEWHEKVEVEIIGMDDLFESQNIDRVRLLKMDVEGMEYDILYNTSMLERVDYFTEELHINARLDYDSRRIDGLANWIANRTKIIHIEPCRMSE
jgi:FkbM family methyltransferase